MILAGIDIGTNALRLLISESTETSHRTLYAARTVTRLGKDLDRTGVLSPDSQERTLSILGDFVSAIRRSAAEQIRVVGTSALRRAKNAGAFVRAVRERTGLGLEIISGREEARLTLLGVRRALSRGRSEGGDPLQSALVADIGGGSTELIVTEAGAVLSESSLELGAVYLTERYLKHDPPLPGEREDLIRAVRLDLAAWEEERLLSQGLHAGSRQVLAGTAGTVTTLAAMALKLLHYHPDLINGFRLSRSSLENIIARLEETPTSGRRGLPGLEAGREDIILAGALIAREIMTICNKDEMLVSDWGLREGIVLDLVERTRGS